MTDQGQPTGDEVAPETVPADADHVSLSEEELLGKLDGEYAATSEPDEATRETGPESDTEEEPGKETVEGQEDKVKELEQQLASVSERYGSSSKEAKRLASELRQTHDLLNTLKQRYELDELSGFEPQSDPGDKPLTRREYEQLEEQRQWQGARDSFFANEKNKDLASPVMRRFVVSALFDESGNLTNPDLSPAEAFKAAGKTVRKVLESARLQGKEEITKVRNDIKDAAVAEGTLDKPKGKPAAEEESPVPEGETYVDQFQKWQDKIRHGGE